MIQYIYFVKCPDCEDEHFDFFNDAKDFALGCLSKKPIITQTEVNRNDFGECIDSSDLGTIWSWEDIVKDTEEEPLSTFSKYETVGVDLDSDPEFTALDNSLDDIPDNFRKPVPADMSIDALVEEMEENEDTVECKWCEELFDKSECHYEVDLGWLCSRCEAAIKSRGEPLTFRENNYWDFLDEEDAELTEASLADVASAANAEFDSHWTSDDLLDMSGITEEPRHMDVHTGLTPSEKAKADFAAYQERSYKNKLAAWKKYKKQKASEVLKESSNVDEEIEFEYDDLKVTLQGPKRDVDDWDEAERVVDFTYAKNKDDVVMDVWDWFITEEDAKEVPGGLETLNNDAEWTKFLETNWDTLLDKYYSKLLDYYRPAAAEEYESTHSLDEVTEVKECGNTTSFLEELEESESYSKRLIQCPECDTKYFDPETGICINCGFI